MDDKGKLFLIPTPLGDTPLDVVLPPYNKHLVKSIRIFTVEQLRTARRFLRKMIANFPIDEAVFFELNEHTKDEFNAQNIINYALKGADIGLLSEAGMPCIADPGNILVQTAHQNNIEVVSLVGPSSLLMALMASGLNGQNFAFNGYLPTEKSALCEKIRQMETSIIKNNQTQLFIETPYRNVQLLEVLLKTCKPSTQLCIACNLSLPDQMIKTMTIELWKKVKNTDLHKKPTVFILG